MSVNVQIEEGKHARTFSNTSRIETDKVEGGSCFWVPESERQLEQKYIHENGNYTPDKYAFSALYVNSFNRISSIDGLKWDYTLDKFNIPKITLVPIDPVKMPEITLIVDPLTGMPEIEIDGMKFELPDLSDMLELDSLDISLLEMDGIPQLAMTGMNMAKLVNLETGEAKKTDLPDSIAIVTPPSKLEYKNGESIDLSGISVVAKKNGEPWSGLPGGVVPPGQLRANPGTASLEKSLKIPHFLPYTNIGDPDYVYNTIDAGMFFTGMMLREFDFFKYGILPTEESMERVISAISGSAGPVCILKCEDVLEATDNFNYYALIFNILKPFLTIVVMDGVPTDVKPGKYYPATKYEFYHTWYGGGKYDGVSRFVLEKPRVSDTSCQLYSGLNGYDNFYSNVDVNMVSETSISVEWPRPVDNKILSDSFTISIDQ